MVKKVSWLRDEEIYPSIPNIDVFVNWLMGIKEHKYFDKFNYYPRNKEILKSVEKKQLFITITKNKPEYMVKFKRYGKLNCCYMGTWEKFWKDKDIESEMIHRWVDLDANYTKMVDLRRIIKYYDNDKERNIEDFLNEFQEYSGY